MKSAIEELNINIGYDILFPGNPDIYHQLFFGIDVTIISTNEINSGKEKIHLQCMPNPINNYANFNFKLSESQNVSLVILDIHGNLAKTILKNEMYSMGDHIIELQNINFKPGLYVARLTTDKEILSTKVVVSK